LACLTAWVIELAAIIIDVLKRRDVAIAVKQRKRQTPIACNPSPVKADAFALEVRVLWIRVSATRPDLLYIQSCNLVPTLNIGVAENLSLSEPTSVDDLFGVGELPANVGSEMLFDTRSPTPEASRGDPVVKRDVPTRFVAEPANTFGARSKAVDLTV
jgi:hypothetical protein